MRAIQAIRQVSDRHIFIAPMALLVALALYSFVSSLLDRTEPILFVGGEIIPPVVQAGGKIQVIRFAYVRHACGGTTYRQITDSKGYVHTFTQTPTMSAQVIPDAHEQRLVGKQFDLSDALSEGQAVFGSYIEYACPWLWFEQNPVQMIWPIKVRLPDLVFDVRRP